VGFSPSLPRVHPPGAVPGPARECSTPRRTSPEGFPQFQARIYPHPSDIHLPRSEAVTFTFTHEPAELYRAYWAGARKGPYRLLVIAFLGLPIAVVVRDLATGSSLFDAIRGNLVWLVLLPGYALVGIPLIYRMGARRALVRYPTLKGEQTLELTDAGVRAANPLNEREVPWSAIQEVWETPEFIFFSTGRRSAFHLPRRAVPDAQLPALRSLIRAHVPAARLLGPSRVT
jgi:hypothetical protein